MATSLGFEVTVPASRVAAFLHALNAGLTADRHLSPEDLRRLRLGEPAGGIGLTLSLPADPELAAFHLEHPDLESADPARVAVGYLWVSARPAQDDGACELAFWSSSREVVEVLRFSPSVRAFFRSLADFADPAEVRVVDEWLSVSRL